MTWHILVVDWMASVDWSTLRLWLALAPTSVSPVSFWLQSPPCAWASCADHDSLPFRSSILVGAAESPSFDAPNRSYDSNCRSIVSAVCSFSRWECCAVISSAAVVVALAFAAAGRSAYCCHTDDVHRSSTNSNRRQISAHRSRSMLSRLRCISVQTHFAASSRCAVCEIHVAQHTLSDRAERSIRCWNLFLLDTNLKRVDTQREHTNAINSIWFGLVGIASGSGSK